MDSTTLALYNDVFTGIYVFLTLIIVVVTIWSAWANSKQARDSLAESQRQSKAAIDAVNEQIKESKNQHQEMIYNQSRPILVCDGLPPSDINKLDAFKIKNVGSGVATDIRCLLSIRSSSNGSPRQALMQPISVIVPGSDDQGQYQYRELKTFYNTIGEYACFTEDNDSTHNIRFLITYHDVFNRIHLSIFDGITLQTWKQIKLLSGISFEIEE